MISVFKSRNECDKELIIIFITIYRNDNILNLDKCKTTFSRSKVTLFSVYTINDVLERVDSIKDISVIFDRKLILISTHRTCYVLVTVCIKIVLY